MSKSITWFYIMLNIYKFGSSYTSWFTKYSHSIDTWIVWKGKIGRVKWNSWHSLHNFSNTEITFFLLPQWVMFKNDFYLDLLIEMGWGDVLNWIVFLQISCRCPTFQCDCPSWYHIPWPQWICFTLL